MELPTNTQPDNQTSSMAPQDTLVAHHAEEVTKPKTGKSFWLDALETIAIALVIFFVIYNFIAQPHLVKGESMLPNYHDGEYILTSKIYNWLGAPRRGDVVVLKSPDDKSVQFIKRIIGLPGEKIKIDDNKITIYNKEHPNGQVLDETYLSNEVITEGRALIREGEVISIPQNQYVVMGDNRNASYDSRSWGFMNKTDLVGRAFFVYWPIPDFGFVAHASYK